MTNSEARKREAARNAAPDTTGLREAVEAVLNGRDWSDQSAFALGMAIHRALDAHPDPTPEPDATVSDPAPPTDAESSLTEIIWETSRADESTISATGANIVARAILTSGWLAARVAEAVEQERAARLALVAKIEALVEDGMTDAGDCCSDYCVADVHDLRLDQAERLEEVLRALLTADDAKATS